MLETTEDPQIAIREYYIADPPKILILNLKRFSANENYTHKNSKHIDVPFELNLDKYLLLSCDTERIKEIQSISKMNSDGNLNLTKYVLYGIVSHSGELNSGHYVAYVKNDEE